MKCAYINLGCKVNAYETEGIASAMEQEGYERVSFGEEADVIVIFTCAVTNTAAAKSRKMIHRSRRTYPNAVIAVAGCYAQIDPEALAEADVLIGTKHKPLLAQYIAQYRATGKRITDVSDLTGAAFEPLPVEQFEGKTRAFLKIQDGCNQFCTYCVIPYARGRERSMEPDQVIEEAKKIASHHPEIVLAGIHTGRYGREYGITLARLMKRILREVPKLQRLRISSIEITELDEEFLDLLESEPRIAPHLHIPLQSGSNGVLRRMGRPYDTEAYYTELKEIRRRVPGISVSTDLMVGFPGETAEEFQETLAFLKRCEFSFLHVFPFSVRNGTAAEKMKDQIDPETKKQRASQCLKLSNELNLAYRKSLVGKEVDVLLETETSGLSGQYVEVTMERPYKKGRMIKAVIREADEAHTAAEGCDQSETE